MGIRTLVLLAMLMWLPLFSPATSAELKLADVANPKSDGPDGKGNTADDTWQFWFELAHAPGTFARLSRHSSTVPAAGIPRKVTGPVASLLPHPKETTGWILHTDWDGRFEGVWADESSGEILVHPYVEKRSHLAVAVTYTVPQDGVYHVTGGITDVQVKPNYPKHDGVIWRIEIADGGKRVQQLGQGKPIGDGHGRPDSGKFEVDDAVLRKGQLLRLVIHPNKWWGQDLTRIDALRIDQMK